MPFDSIKSEKNTLVQCWKLLLYTPQLHCILTQTRSVFSLTECLSHSIAKAVDVYTNHLVVLRFVQLQCLNRSFVHRITVILHNKLVNWQNLLLFRRKKVKGFFSYQNNLPYTIHQRMSTRTIHFRLFARFKWVFFVRPPTGNKTMHTHIQRYKQKHGHKPTHKPTSTFDLYDAFSLELVARFYSQIFINSIE